MAGLPNVEGPKLMPFIPDGSPYDLEFLEFIGGGEHGYVWKVSINGEVYALKMVCSLVWFKVSLMRL